MPIRLTLPSSTSVAETSEVVDVCVVPYEIGYVGFAMAKASRKVIATVLLIITSEFCQL